MSRQLHRQTYIKPPLGYFLNGHPLTRGLKMCALLNEGAGQNPKNLVNNQSCTVSGTITVGGTIWKNTFHGQGFINMSASTSGGLDFGPLSNYGSFSNISFAMRACWPASGINRGFICSNVSTGSWGIDAIVGSTQWECFVNTGAGTKIVNPTPSTTNGAYAQLIVVTYDASVLRSYVNGTAGPTLTVNSATSFDPTAHVFVGGWAGSSGQNYTAPIIFAYLWNRVLTPAEVSNLWVEPYAMVHSPAPTRSALAPATLAKFRKSLSRIGTKTGSRQVHVGI